MNFEAADEFIIDKLRRELKPQLTYHSLEHTLDVYTQASFISQAEGIPWKEQRLIKTAALLHDIGLIYVYDKHEEKSCEIAQSILPGFEYSSENIRTICNMIMATCLPQNPENLLEMILCDADLDYLGREDFHMLSHRLSFEWRILNINPMSLHDWYQLQKKFLSSHHYFTETARIKRNTIKMRHLSEIQDLCFCKPDTI